MIDEWAQLALLTIMGTGGCAVLLRKMVDARRKGAHSATAAHGCLAVHTTGVGHAQTFHCCR